jgi:phage-related protein
MRQLRQKDDKDSRIKLGKIQDYIKILQMFGTRAGEPYIKHLEGEIWELRPLRDRVLFAAWDGDGFVLLHHFLKVTRKTPQREIDKAKRELKDLRGGYQK